MSAELVDPTDYTPPDTPFLLDASEPPATPEEEEEGAVSEYDAFSLISQEVGAVQVAANELNEAATLIGSTAWEDAANLLARLRRARQLAQVVENGLETHIAKARIAAGLRDPVEVPGVGVVTHRRTASRKDWDHEALAKEVIGLWIDEHGGEIPDGFETRNLLMTHAAISYWRTTGLKKLGIDVGEYCTTIPGRLTVDIQAGEN